MITKWLRKLDGFTERAARQSARTTSRRALLSGIGTTLIGVGALTLLPIFRTNAFATPGKGEVGDASDCDYWRNCALDGYLCSCCGGSATTCPPGSAPSDITWIGTCKNPTDGKDDIISYNDCCGQSVCGRCLCSRAEGATPIYRPQTSNDLNWCSGNQADIPYVCSLSVVIGVGD
jgi:methylamine dehydrogenase light chain